MSFQNASSSAWKIVAVVRGPAVSAHDFELPGASPNHSAIFALVSGDDDVVDERVRAARFLVLELIIQVSDQPVAPSGGLMTSTGTAGVSPLSRLVMICHVVPTFASPCGSRPSA